MEKLKELLDGLVAEKSLSFDVLEQLRKVKTESDELIKNNLLLGESITAKDKIINEKNSEINGLTALVKKWDEKYNAITKREETVLDIEHKNEIEKLKAEHSAKTLQEVKEVVAIVFRNTILRKNIMGREAVDGGANPNSYSSSEVNKTETINED